MVAGTKLGAKPTRSIPRSTANLSSAQMAVARGGISSFGTNIRYTERAGLAGPLHNTRKCVGGVPGWTFDHFDEPENHDGWEWRATFQTPLWVRRSCFNNLKIQAASGGHTHKRRDNRSDEKYKDDRCDGNS